MSCWPCNVWINMLHNVHTLTHLHMHVERYAHTTPVLLCCFVLHSKTVLLKRTTKITVTTTHPRQCPQSRHITAAQGLRRKYEGVSFRMRSFHWAQPVWNKCTEHCKAKNLSHSNDRLALLGGLQGTKAQCSLYFLSGVSTQFARACWTWLIRQESKRESEWHGCVQLTCQSCCTLWLAHHEIHSSCTAIKSALLVDRATF